MIAIALDYGLFGHYHHVGHSIFYYDLHVHTVNELSVGIFDACGDLDESFVVNGRIDFCHCALELCVLTHKGGDFDSGARTDGWQFGFENLELHVEEGVVDEGAELVASLMGARHEVGYTSGKGCCQLTVGEGGLGCLHGIFR